jgi:4-hydroxybenzoate polyprenyltransferase
VVDLLRLLRAHNLVVAAAGVLAGGWIALGHLAVPADLGWAALSGMGLGAVGNVLNDIWDEPGDRANARADRPLAAGRVRRGTADLLVLWGTLVGLAGAALVSGTLVALAALCLVLMGAYSPVLKRWGLPGNLTVAAVAGFPLVYGALAVSRATTGLVPWVLAAWLHFGRELLKDLADVTGDRALLRRTIPIAWGELRARRLARAVLIGFVPVSLVLPVLAGYGVWYYPVAAAADVLVVAAVLAGDRFDVSIRRLKLAMPVGVAALVLGRLG